MSILLRGVGSNADLFSPLDIDNLQLWLSANRGLNFNDGDPVETWPDFSGNGNDATQPFASKKPIYKVNIVNGRPILRLDGMDDFMETSAFASDLSQPNTVIVAVIVNNIEGDSLYIFEGIDMAKRHGVLSNITRTPDGLYAYAGVVFQPNVAFPKGTIHIHTVLFNGAASEYWLDGASQGTGDVGAHVLSGATMGSNVGGGAARLDGDYYSIIVYDGDIGASNRRRVEEYLAQRLGITL